MESLLGDIRYAARNLIKRPGFTAIAVITLALGIGVNTAVFTWLEVLVLNPTPLVKNAGELVAVNTARPDGTGIEADPISYQTYLEWRQASQSFDGLIAHNPIRLNLRQGNEVQARPIWGELVSGNYFEVLGVSAAIGRTFTPEEERQAAPVVVIADRLWRAKFGADRSVVGRSVQINGVPLTVIGIAPEGFHGALAAYAFEAWLPVTLQPTLQRSNNRIVDRSSRWLQGTARLKPGITLTQADAEMRTLARNISQAHGDSPVTAAAVRLMRERFSGPTFYPLFSGLLAVSTLILLIACANLANLLLARSSTRQKEFSIRLALGAGRWRIVRQLLIESLMLSLIGGGVGLLFAFTAKDSLKFLFPVTPQPYLWALSMDWRVVAYALVTMLVTVVLFGLTPALQASRPALAAALQSEGRAVSSSSRLRSSLVVIQVAFSMVALVCAGLFLRSLQRAQEVDLGFSDPSHLLLVTTDLNVAGLKPAEGSVVTDRLLDRVRSLPGVASASYSTMVPLGFSGHVMSDTKVEGYVPAPDEPTGNERVIVSDGYFETMGIPILNGRGIAPTDRADSLRVAVVNEAFAKRYFPGGEAMGKRVDQGEGWATIVGIAKDGKYHDLEERPTPLIYHSMRQWYSPALTLHVRTIGKPRSLIENVRGAFGATNGDLPFLDPRTMTEHMAASTFRQTFSASMLSGFGILALLLVSFGLYGIVSYAVAQRKRELAIRIALGASTGNVMGLVLKYGFGTTLTGLAVGLCLALMVGRVVKSQLFGASASDPATFVGIPLLLMIVSLLACWLPARRATKVDPLEALRSE